MTAVRVQRPERPEGAGGARSPEGEHVTRARGSEGATRAVTAGPGLRDWCWVPWLLGFWVASCWLLVQVARGFGL